MTQPPTAKPPTAKPTPAKPPAAAKAPKKTAKKTTKKAKPERSFEQTLWHTADKLRGSVESSEYKHVVLSLIFLKFVSDKFEKHRAALIADGKQNYIDMVEFYTMSNVFYLPEPARPSSSSTPSKTTSRSRLTRRCTPSRRTTRRSAARCPTTTSPAWGSTGASWRRLSTPSTASTQR